jgi:DNA polymerase-3 subunit delta
MAKNSAPQFAGQKGVYIFLGTEEGKKQDAVKEIRKQFSKDGPLEETLFFAGEVSVVEIANAVQTPSLFSASRMFIVKNAEQIKKKDDVALMASCMKELALDTALILISDEFKLSSGIDDACRKENRKIFYEMFENEKTEWVRSFFRREGYFIDEDGVDAVLEMVENNTDALRRDCLRLMLFLPKGKSVGSSDVHEWLSHNREETTFTLFSRIAFGDKAKALEVLRTLLAAKESPQSIFAGLSWCFRKLRDYLGLLAKGEPSSFDLKLIGLSSPKAKSDYSAAARIYSIDRTDACLALCAEYDMLVRSFGNPFEQILMDVWLLRLMAPA